MPTLYEVIMMLAFVFIFLIVHVACKNIRQICILSCKIITTIYLWFLVWVTTQLEHLPEWKISFSDSVWTLVNMTKGEL